MAEEKGEVAGERDRYAEEVAAASCTTLWSCRHVLNAAWPERGSVPTSAGRVLTPGCVCHRLSFTRPMQKR